MHTLPAIFALLVGAVGWYYLFFSKAASRLGGIEEQRSNRLRGLLRRINAILMLLIALGIAFATYKFEDRRGYEDAYLLTWEAKYHDWVLGYVDAWRDRMRQNGGIIPTKVWLDGKVGGDDGKWYGAVYGWGFTVVVPQTLVRTVTRDIPGPTVTKTVTVFTGGG